MERTRGGSPDLRAAWDEHAAAWIRWAREPGLDSYRRFHRDWLRVPLFLHPRARR